MRADRDAATALGGLMHDFFCTSADDMHYKILAEKVRYYKEDAKEVETMCKVIEDMRKEVADEAVEWVALNMIDEGELSLEQVAKYSRLPLERVQELAASISNG